MRTLNIFRNLLMRYKKLQKAVEKILEIEGELPPSRQNEEMRIEYEKELRRVRYKIRKTKKRLEDFA